MRAFLRRWIIRRPLRPGETDFEALFVGVGILCVAAAALWIGFGLPWPSCTFQKWTNVPCPSCGGTRAILSAAGGNLRAAVTWNPGMLLLGTLSVLAWTGCLLSILFGRHRWRLQPDTGKQLSLSVKWFLLAGILANWAYVLVRGGS